MKNRSVILFMVGCWVLLIGCNGELNVFQLEVQIDAPENVPWNTQTFSVSEVVAPTHTYTVSPTKNLEPVLSSTPTPHPAVQHTPTATIFRTPTEDTRPDPKEWKNWSIIPTVSSKSIEIYQNGILMGTNPRAFSIVGDCQSEPPVFMGIYATNRYILREEEAFLEETIANFAGNFDRQHATVKNGLSVASVFSPLWSPKELCLDGETPLACEFRLNKPSIIFVNLGTNWKNGDGYSHEIRLREIVEFAIEHGALPILSTKGDNHEGDHSINFTTARLAFEYDIPLWNYWAAIQYLPNHGIDQERKDANYLTIDAWNERSYTGLRALDKIWRRANGLDIP